MKSPTLLALCATIAFAIHSSAAPVTNWVVGLGTPALTNPETSSPTLGDNTAEDADNVAMHAAFSPITLGVGDRLTFSGSMQISSGVGSAASAVDNELRIGLFDHNGSSTTSGWFGYYASNPSGTIGAGERRRNSGAYYSQNGTTIFGTNVLVDTSKTLVDETYDFSLSVERTATGIGVSLSLENDLGYAIVPATFEDTAPNSFIFDRVGFLIGSRLNADQVQFNNLDVTLVPEPSTLALLACGGLAMAGCGFKRRGLRRTR